MKILLLIIHHDHTLYNKMIKFQQNYIHKHEHIDSYIVKMDQNITNDIEIKGDSILVKGEEKLLNVLYKTIYSLEILTQFGQSNKYNYIIRSNASTVIDLENLYNYCISIKNQNLYTGGRLLHLDWIDEPGGIIDEQFFGTPFIQGCFIIMSMDIVKKILSNKTKLKDYRNREYIAYRNHRASSYSWGDREADIEEIKNQINCIYNIYE